MSSLRCKSCNKRGCTGECQDIPYLEDYMDDIEVGHTPKTTSAASYYVVPSEDTATFADAIDAIAIDITPRSNITIKLGAGDHAIPDNGFSLPQSVSIIGDHDDLAGAVFWRRPNYIDPTGASSSTFEHYRHDSSARGNGPFDIVLGNDNTITVYGVDENGTRSTHDDPDFSSVTKKREIIFFTIAGTLTTAKVVVSPRGKNILAVYGDRIPFPSKSDMMKDYDHVIFDPEYGGYGFFFPPNVYLRGSTTNMKMASNRDLTLLGVRVRAPTGLKISAGVLSMVGCWYESDVQLSGHIASSEFNVNTDVLRLSGASGALNRQSCIGAASSIITSTSKINLDFAHICSSKNGVVIKNGSSTSLHSGLTVNCNTGLTCSVGSTADITRADFYANRVGIKAIHGSTVTSDTNIRIVASSLPVHLIDSRFIAKGLDTAGSKYYAAIDDEILISEADLKHDHIYPKGSSMTIDDSAGIHSLDFLSLPGTGKQHELDLAQLGISKVASKEVGRGLTHIQAISKLQISKKKEGKFIE